MKPNHYAILSRCVEDGVRAGWRRAYKHTDSPGEETAQATIENAVMTEICEYFSFDDDNVPMRQE